MAVLKSSFEQLTTQMKTVIWTRGQLVESFSATVHSIIGVCTRNDIPHHVTDNLTIEWQVWEMKSEISRIVVAVNFWRIESAKDAYYGFILIPWVTSPKVFVSSGNGDNWPFTLFKNFTLSAGNAPMMQMELTLGKSGLKKLLNADEKETLVRSFYVSVWVGKYWNHISLRKRSLE